MNFESKPEKIAIIGAGIAGLTAAIMLRNAGHEVEIFEAGKTVRGIGAGIGLASNAMKAFEYLGLEKEVIQISNRLEEFQIVDKLGKIIIKPDAKRIIESYNLDNFAIHRADLHALLVLKIPTNSIQTNKKLKKFSQNENSVLLEFEDGENKGFDFLIGADGVNSVIRQQFFPNSQPRYAGYWCWRGVVNFDDSNPIVGTEVWGRNGRFGISPLTNNRIYWYCCINSTGNDAISGFGLEELKQNFKDYFPLISKLLELTKADEVISTPIMDIKPISTYAHENVLLIGDAAHATTPNMGQGACMAIEDVAVFQEEIRKNPMKIAFKNFEKRRLKRTHYIINTSWNAGKVAQSDTKFLNFLRDNLMRVLPEKISQNTLKSLLEEDFMKV